MYLLIFELVPGETVESTENFYTKDFLLIARVIVSALATLYVSYIIHNSINIDYIIVDYNK